VVKSALTGAPARACPQGRARRGRRRARRRGASPPWS